MPDIKLEQKIILKSSLIIVFLVVFISLVQAQRDQVIQDTVIVLSDTVGVQADWIAHRSEYDPNRLHADIISVQMKYPGYYRIIPKVYYNSGDEQKNESFYMTIVSADSTPRDPNAGVNKVVPDDGIAIKQHTNWRDAGLFYFGTEPTLLRIHHYIAIMAQYPGFLVGELNLDAPESVKLPDSLRIMAEPQLNGAIQLSATTSHPENENGQVRWVAYPGESVNYKMVVRNKSRNRMRSASLVNQLPAYLSPITFSMAPSAIDHNRVTWDLPDIQPLDSVQIWFSAQLSLKTPPGLTPLIDQARLNVANDIDTTNNVAAVLVYAQGSNQNQGNTDLVLSLTSKTDSIVYRYGNWINYVEPGDTVQYQVNIVNQGQHPARTVQIRTIMPELFVMQSMSLPAFRVAGDTLIWNFASIEPDSVIQIHYNGFISQLSMQDSLWLISQALVAAENDTFINNNFDTDRILARKKSVPEKQPDIQITQYTATDSFVIHGSDTLKFVNVGETFAYYFNIENLSDVAARYVRVSAIFDPTLTIGTMVPSPIYTSQDTLVWVLENLSPYARYRLYIEGTIASELPEGIHDFANAAWIRAENEDGTKLANNYVQGTVYTWIAPLVELVARIEATPSTVDVTDSIRVRVQSSVPISAGSWDLTIHLPGGRMLTDFANDFIGRTGLPAGIWIDIPEWYHPRQLSSALNEENIVFELSVTDTRLRQATARAEVTLTSSNHLVLDRNVFKPESENPLQIRFKLEQQQSARLDIYDISGRHIVQLADDTFNGGWNIYPWKGALANGQKIGSGVYLVTLRAESFKAWKKFIIVR